MLNGTVVWKSDHPFMLDNPEILVGKSGCLTAIFFRRADEQLNALKARLIASRVCLPLHTRCILATDVLGDCYDCFDDILLITQENHQDQIQHLLELIDLKILKIPGRSFLLDQDYGAKIRE